MKKYILIAIIAIGLVACTTKKAVVTETVNSNNSSEQLEAPVIMLTAELALGKTIFEAKCGKCHDLVKPESYSKEKWKPIMLSMQEAAKLTDDERVMVYNYVTMNL